MSLLKRKLQVAFEGYSCKLSYMPLVPLLSPLQWAFPLSVKADQYDLQQRMIPITQSETNGTSTSTAPHSDFASLVRPASGHTHSQAFTEPVIHPEAFCLSILKVSS